MESIFTKDTTAVVVSLDGSEWPEGVFVFSNYDQAEEWMKWKIACDNPVAEKRL